MLVKTEWIERITQKYVSLSVVRIRNNNQHIGLIKMDLIGKVYILNKELFLSFKVTRM